MEDALLTDAPERDRAEIAGYIESHGGAIVLRVGDKLGSDAKAAMLAHRKEHGELPPYDTVWIGGATMSWSDILGRESSAAVVDGAGSVTRSGHHETVGERQGRQPAQDRWYWRWHFWWGGVMCGGGAVFAILGKWWPASVALLVFGLLYSWQGHRGL